MERDGQTMLRVVIVGVVILALGLIMLQGFGDGQRGFNIFAQEGSQSSAVDTCNGNVEGYCNIEGNAGTDWTQRYPNCQQYADEIMDGDTTCPGSSDGNGGGSTDCSELGHSDCTDADACRWQQDFNTCIEDTSSNPNDGNGEEADYHLEPHGIPCEYIESCSA